MLLNRKAIFLKSWMWSLIGSGILAMVFWVVSDVFNLLEGGKNIITFTNTLICVAVVGGAVGAGVVFWRILDKYYSAHLRDSMKRYVWLNLAGLVVIILVLLWGPISFLAALWSLIAPLSILHILSKSKILTNGKVKAPSKSAR